MVTQFEQFLDKSDLAKNTVTSYVWAVNNHGAPRGQDTTQFLM